MRLYKTGHVICDTVSNLIGDLPDGDYGIAYGILRGTPEKLRQHNHWFEVDRGFWGANHFDGNYRISYKGTQPIYYEDDWTGYEGDFEPWKDDGYTLICPPTEAVCEFYDIGQIGWLWKACRNNPGYKIRYKGDPEPIDWQSIGKVITFNSTVGIEALKRGIPVESDPTYSTIGSYMKYSLDPLDRHKLFSFMQASQFKLAERDKICQIINRYLST